MKRTAFLLTLALWCSTSMFADFSYEQTSKITGGAMAGMMKFAGAFSKQAREPIKSTILLKGDRMAHVNDNSAQVFDLSKETITHIDFQKKTYSVMTFAQFAEALKAMTSKAKDGKGEEGMQLTAKPSLKQTGQKKSIAGMDTHEVILTIEMEGTDTKTGKPVMGVTTTSDMWLTPQIPGYEEVREFHKRLAAKMNFAPSMGMMAPAGSQQGMAELFKEMSKLDGVPVYQVVSMGGNQAPGAQGENSPAADQKPQPQEQQADKPSAAGALGKLGRFGGLGGFGRKKKQDDQPQAEAQPASSQPGDAPAQRGSGPGALIEMTTELSGFSSGPIDGSKFEVPAGFKQVEDDMLKRSRR